MQILKGHDSAKPVRSLAFAPDGTRLASSARDYRTFLWDLSTGKHQAIDEDNSYTVAFAPDGKQVATGRGSGLSVWDSATGELRTVDLWSELCHAWHVAYSPDGRLLGAVSAPVSYGTGQVRLYDAATLKRLPLGDGHLGATACLAFSRDGRTLATGHHEGPLAEYRVVRLWDVPTRKESGLLWGLSAAAVALAFSPDGRFLAAAAGRTLYVWEVAAGRLVVTHKAPALNFKDVAFTPDGRFLAFISNDATARFWDVGGWREVGAFDWKLGPLISLAVAPDSKRAAAGSGRGKIVVWDVEL
jgi:WD40 repeat protein